MATCGIFKTLPCEIRIVQNCSDSSWDCILIVGCIAMAEPDIRKVMENRLQIDSSFESQITLMKCPCAAGGRLVFSPISKVHDYTDVRLYWMAASKAIVRAIQAGSTAPLLVLPWSEHFEHAELMALLGALAALYVPIQLREDPKYSRSIKALGVNKGMCKVNIKSVITLAMILESGLYVARDIGGPDPERMTPKNVAEYVRNLFDGTDVSYTWLDDEETLREKYPLFDAVNRAASVIDRHKGGIIFMEYKSEEPIRETLFFIGKGVTYDSGGMDLKSKMAGMSRDKCGAAAVAGIMQVCSLLKPSGLHVFGYMPMVRNSIGENSCVADEILISRSGKRIRLGNTDAEGRMILADVLCQAREEAVNCPEPHLFTIATLTGHAYLSFGSGYTAILDNSVARSLNYANKLQEHGDSIGNPMEISTLRREDLKFVKGVAKGEDLIQCNPGPSTMTERGHQVPMAFLIAASGMDQHELNSDKPIKYTHLDIAGSAGEFPLDPSGAPLLALVKTHFL